MQGAGIWKKIIFSLKIWAVRAISVFNGNYNGEKLRKHEISFSGTKIHSYELIFNPHIEEDDTNTFCFVKKINLIKKKLRKLRF